MSFKTLRNAGGITATQTADDAAHETDIGKLSPAASFRVTEYAGQDVLFLISDDYTAVTSSNGFYLKASTSTTVVPSTRPFFVGEAPIALNGTDSDSSNAGDGILQEAYDDSGNLEGVSAASESPGYILLDHGQHGYRISVINETASSDGAVYVEEIVQGVAGP